MPLYDYDCAACGRRIEVVHGVFAPGPTHCPNCGSGPLRKAITAAAVHYKGSGWAKKERRTVASGAKTAGDTAAAEADAKDAGATTSAPKAESGTSGDAAASDRPSAPSKASTASTATKTD